MPIGCYAVRAESRHGAAVGGVAVVPGACAAGIEARYAGGEAGGVCADEVLEDAFGHGGAADVAHADEEDGYGF